MRNEEEEYYVGYEDITVAPHVNGGTVVHAVVIREPAHIRGRDYNYDGKAVLTFTRVDDEELVQRIKNICGALETVLNETIKKRRKEE